MPLLEVKITVIGCVSTGGYQLSLMTRKLRTDMVKGETLYGLSRMGGLINNFYFLQDIPQSVLLLVDGHSKHYCPETMVLAAKESRSVCTTSQYYTCVATPQQGLF